MGKEVEYYAYLSEHTIERLYAQIGGRWSFPALGLGIGLAPPFVKFTATKGEGKREDLGVKVKAVVAHLQRHEPHNIGTIDEPKRYISGTLQMFSYFLPQGFGGDIRRPELIYFGGSTQQTILGLAGAASYVFTSTGGEMTHEVSSALPHLTRVIAQNLRVKTMYGRALYDEHQALDAMKYMEVHNRRRHYLENHSFFAVVKLDSYKLSDRITYPGGKRVVLAWPLYVARAD
jgi:hypothetical protein